MPARPRSTRKHRTLWGDAVRRFTRNRLAVFGLVVVFAAFVFVALFANVIAPYPNDKADFSKVRLLPMRDMAHPLGTDEVGRDYIPPDVRSARR